MLRVITVLITMLTAVLWSGIGTPAQAEDGHFIPLLVYRTGPYAPNGIPTANGYVDYLKLLDARDGGINGVKVVWEECETQYNTKLGVECYEKLKGKGTAGAALVNPYSTGITYQLIPKASVDKIPIHSMGYGRTAAADGRVFKWAFNFPTTYWSQASTFVKYVGQQEGGMDKLKGKKIALTICEDLWDIEEDLMYNVWPMEELVKLKGVARKTANIVLAGSFGKIEGIAVDTHVHRLSNLLGLSDQKNPEKVEQDLMDLFPREKWWAVNYMLITHGRRVCNAKKPDCEHCVLNDICPSAFSFKHNKKS